MKYFVTGHTGFKGAWLSVMLKELGHELHGYALNPADASLFATAGIESIFESDTRSDIRDREALLGALKAVNPDVVIHLAAQALVIDGYRRPKETFDTNFNGTLNLISSLDQVNNLKAALIITTDKVYSESDKVGGCSESDRIGGLDPYSASKAAADLLTQSWAKLYPALPISIARAGNVIGGGDRSSNRLLPDLIFAFFRGEMAEIRNPNSVRPWQHVMDCLSGYLALVDSMLANGTRGEWNFGPAVQDHVTVKEIVDLAASVWGSTASWRAQHQKSQFPESPALRLNVSKAEKELNFHNKMSAKKAVEVTVSWEKRVLSGELPMDVCMAQAREHLGFI
jgi:CDP-glucose 4,6-dehydratase